MPHIGAFRRPCSPGRASKVRQHSTTDSARTPRLAQLHPGSYTSYLSFYTTSSWNHLGSLSFDFPGGELEQQFPYNIHSRWTPPLPSHCYNYILQDALSAERRANS
ncbi:hypothetical protein IG631_02498 [Alternaria alternata]|nr:hypothetical protein IG631_02498 [Alternaria alternata]